MSAGRLAPQAECALNTIPTALYTKNCKFQELHT